VSQIGHYGLQLTLAVMLWMAQADNAAEPAPAQASPAPTEATNPQLAEAKRLNGEALAHYRAGEYAQAIPKAQRALQLREAVLGPDHQDVATSLCNLALLLRTTGRYAEAELLYRRALAIDAKALGPDHPGTVIDLNNLAELLRTTGRYAEAEPLYRRALAIDEKALGPDHPDVATDLYDLALLLKTTGRYAEAEPLYRRALAINEKALGPDQPDVATDLNNLAELLRTTRRYTEAEPLYRRALAIDEKALGPDQPDVATDLNNLALLLRTTGRYAEAEPLYRRALAIDEKALGPDHPRVATSLNNLAELLRTTGRYAEAEPLYRRALAIDEKALGPDHPDVANDLYNLASLLRTIGHYDDAERLLLRARRIAPTADVPLIGAHAVQIWNSATGRSEQSINVSAPVFDVAFSPDASKLATAGKNGIGIWHVATGKNIWQAGEAALSVAFAPDSKFVAEVDESRVTGLRDAATGLQLRTFRGATGRLTAVVFSPNGRLLATAGEDQAIRVWDVATGRPLMVLTGHSVAVRSLTFSPDGKSLASGDDDGVIQLWSLASGGAVRRFQRNQESMDRGSVLNRSSLLALAVSPDGRELAAASADHTCTLWDVSTGKESVVLRGHSYAVTSVTFQMQGEKLIVVTGSLDHSIKFWDSETGQEFRSFTTSDGPISALAISSDGKHIATATDFSEIGDHEQTLYVVAVGISNYHDRGPSLPYSVPDARAIASAFQNGASGVFNRVETHLLVEESATRSGMITALRQIEDKARPTDTLVFFFAGHSAESDNETIFLPADGISDRGVIRKFIGLAPSELLRFLDRIPTQHQLIVLDTGSTGSVFRAMDRGIRQQNPKLSELMERSVAVITQSGRSLALEDAPLGHGLLTSAILSGLSGEASQSDVITAGSLVSYMARHGTTQHRAGEQFAQFLFGDDFPLSRVPKNATKQVLGSEEPGNPEEQAPSYFRVKYEVTQAMLSSESQSDRGFPAAKAPAIKALPPRHDYALIFAGTHYDEGTGWPALTYPQRDTEAVRDLLQDQYGFAVEIVADPDYDTILSKLREYRTKRTYGPEDQLLVMFAGHGAASDVDGYIVARDSKVSDENFHSYLSFSDLHTILDRTPARHVLLILDTCFDGAFEPRFDQLSLLNSSGRSSLTRFQPVAWSSEARGPRAFLAAASVWNGMEEQNAYADGDAAERDREEFIHDKLRYKTRWYLVSGGREPVPDQSVFIQAFLATLRSVSAVEGVRTAKQIYSTMERLKPRPHEEGFGSNEPWGEFVFEVRPRQINH
jgi:WD40 repeat protein/uncharacterized caspase-like protein/Tfp pilus assembly protein PilF